MTLTEVRNSIHALKSEQQNIAEAYLKSKGWTVEPSIDLFSFTYRHPKLAFYFVHWEGALKEQGKLEQ